MNLVIFILMILASILLLVFLVKRKINNDYHPPEESKCITEQLFIESRDPYKELVSYQGTLKELSELLKYTSGIYNKDAEDEKNISLIKEAIIEIEKYKGNPPRDLIIDVEGMIENFVNYYDLKGN